ncbi:hypothetical protein QP938_07435 [Porticoccaceae bacterium LTM1]|nr:hypothetical protein QP938_07435 [Porticoccaceae bacterium LTM1]
MAHLASAQSLKELKTIYRKLASIHHPDRGGCVESMQQLNLQYQLHQERLQLAANDPLFSVSTHSSWENGWESIHSRNKQPTPPPCNFNSIAVGDKIYINATLCKVLGVTDDSFRAQAIGRERQSVFDKKTGIGIFNRRLRASYSPLDRQRYNCH